MSQYQVQHSYRHPQLSQIANALKQANAHQALGIPISTFLLLVDQAGKLMHLYVQKNASIVWQSNWLRVIAIAVLQLAINSREDAQSQVSDDQMLEIAGQLDSLFFNTWLKFKQDPAILQGIKELAKEK